LTAKNIDQWESTKDAVAKWKLRRGTTVVGGAGGIFNKQNSLEDFQLLLSNGVLPWKVTTKES
jgi:hypothetical protein